MLTSAGLVRDANLSPRSDPARMHAAGKATQRVNIATFAVPHEAPKHSIVMASYGRPYAPPQPPIWSLLQPDPAATGQMATEQGSHTTRFRKGFMRRQADAINPYAARLENDAAREAKQAAATDLRRALLEQKQTFKGTGYNFMTGEELGPAPLRLPGRKHVVDADRASGPGADKPAFRLRDSTSRFHATAQEMPHRPERAAMLAQEGLTTKRTSTVIGVGKTLRHEISSVGIRDAFAGSKTRVASTNFLVGGYATK